MADIDDTDLMLIELLQKDARTPQHELAKTVGLAASSVNERIRKLGERGLITGYHARISSDVMGYDLLAFVYVAWSKPETEKAFLKKVTAQASVMEIHHVTGIWNYMLKVRVKNTRMAAYYSAASLAPALFRGFPAARFSTGARNFPV